MGATVALVALALLVVLGALAIVINWPPIVNAIGGPVLVAVLFAGIAMRFLGLAKFRAEAEAGYSTLQDLPGFDLRHATTGEIIRPASVKVPYWSKISWVRTARRFKRYER